MQTFVDNKGEKWTIGLTLGKVRKISHKIGLDLLNPKHYLLILSSLTERLTFVFLLCEEQAKEMRLDADAFEERLYGDGVATEASQAFLNECEVFFRKLGRNETAELTKMTTQSMKVSEAELEKMASTGQLDSLLKKAQEEMEALIQSTDGAGSQS